MKLTKKQTLAALVSLGAVLGTAAAGLVWKRRKNKKASSEEQVSETVQETPEESGRDEKEEELHE